MFSLLIVFIIGLSNSAVVEKPERHNYAWKKISRSDSESLIDLVFALKQNGVDTIRDILIQVSTPTHERYGQHLTMEEIHEITAPSYETTSTIKNWLISNDIKESDIENATPNGDFLRVRYVNQQRAICPHVISVYT